MGPLRRCSVIAVDDVVNNVDTQSDTYEREEEFRYDRRPFFANQFLPHDSLSGVFEGDFCKPTAEKVCESYQDENNVEDDTNLIFPNHARRHLVITTPCSCSIRGSREGTAL
jgi:hypothetical protein